MTDESRSNPGVATERVGCRVRAQEFPTDWTLCDVDDNELIDVRTRIADKPRDLETDPANR